MRVTMPRLFHRNPYRAIEKAIGYSFRAKQLLETSLLHRSFRHEHEGINEDNERLEFLGDSALSLAAGIWLYRRFPDLQEGDLTRLRSQITSGKALTKIARDLGLGAYLKLGRGEEQTGGHDRPSNLENALEALIGAAFLDGGIRAVEKIFNRIFAPIADPLGSTAWEDNPKGKLQEISLKRWHKNPVYRVISHTGPPHAKIFRVRAEVKNGMHGVGKGLTKRDAEAEAAANLLKKLGVTPTPPGTA